MTDPLPLPTTEYDAARLLFELRWPDACWACEACGHRRATQLRRRPRVFECNVCGLPCRVTAGSSLHGCRVPLVKVARAAALLSRPSSISSRQLAREIDVSRETAWSLGHRLRTGFLPQTERLEGEVVLSQVTFRRRVLRGPRPARSGSHRALRPAPRPRRRRKYELDLLPRTRFQVLWDASRRLVVLPGGREPHALRRFVDAHAAVERPHLHPLRVGFEPGRIGDGVHQGVSDRWMPLYACAIAGWHNERIRGRDPGRLTLARALAARAFPFWRVRPREAAQSETFADWNDPRSAEATVRAWDAAATDR